MNRSRCAEHGSVYVLWNLLMPELVKIGRTVLSPHDRAAQISKATGVPYPFDVVCWLEVRDVVRAERWIHDILTTTRVSPGREFFRAGPANSGRIVGALKHYGEGSEFIDEQVAAFMEPLTVDAIVDPWPKGFS
jgi:hypothetical protein